MHTKHGTVAGHPVADLAFALADAEADDLMHARLLDENFFLTLPSGGVADYWNLATDDADTMPLTVDLRRPVCGRGM